MKVRFPRFSSKLLVFLFCVGAIYALSSSASAVSKKTSAKKPAKLQAKPSRKFTHSILDGTYSMVGLNPRHPGVGPVKQSYAISGDSIRGTYAFTYNSHHVEFLIAGTITAPEPFQLLDARSMEAGSPIDNQHVSFITAKIYEKLPGGKLRLIGKDIFGFICPIPKPTPNTSNSYFASNSSSYGDAVLRARTHSMRGTSVADMLIGRGQYGIDHLSMWIRGQRNAKTAPPPPDRNVSEAVQFILDKVLETDKEIYFSDPIVKKVTDKLAELLVRPEAVATGQSTVISTEADRRTAILTNKAGQFVLQENPKASGERPLSEFRGAFADVNRYESIDQDFAKALGTDPDLVKAIMYMETSHGAYDILGAPFDANTSILPMNIRTSSWEALGIPREYYKRPKVNIFVGTWIISALAARVPSHRIDQIASLYVSLAADYVNDYGARVEQIYTTAPWRTSIRPESVKPY